VADALVEHRMYLPLAGLIIGLVAVIAMIPMRRSAAVSGMCAVLALASAVSWQRSRTWRDPVELWKDAVAKSPRKQRPYPHLIYSYVLANRCTEAVTELERAGSALPKDYATLINSAEAYGCAQKLDQALEKLREASKLNPCAEVYGLMSLVLARGGRREDALKYAEIAIAKEAPGSDMSHFYRGQWFAIAQQFESAEAEYELALRLNPHNPEARSALANLMRANTVSYRLWRMPM
jgi:tetratricopeptide (TPR) repeat protein